MKREPPKPPPMRQVGDPLGALAYLPLIAVFALLVVSLIKMLG